MSGKRIFLLLILVGTGIGIWVLLSSPIPEGTSALSQSSGISLFWYDEQGKITWAVHAKTGDMKKGEESTLYGVSLSFVSGGEDEVKAECDTLSYSGDEAKLTGNVALTEVGGIHLVTESADWDTTTREISSSDVTIEVQSGSLTAPMFRYQTDERRAVMSGGVHATVDGASVLTVDGDDAEAHADLISITGNVHVYVRDETYTADRLEYSPKDDVTTLSGGLVGTLEHGSITGDELVINKNEISASGGVHISLANGFFGGSDGT